MNTERNFIGIEANPEYYELAVRRINEAGASVLENGNIVTAQSRKGLESWGLDLGRPSSDIPKEDVIHG